MNLRVGVLSVSVVVFVVSGEYLSGRLCIFLMFYPSPPHFLARRLRRWLPRNTHQAGPLGPTRRLHGPFGHDEDATENVVAVVGPASNEASNDGGVGVVTACSCGIIFAEPCVATATGSAL